MLSRYPVDETPSITLHLTPPKNASLPSGQQGSNSLYSSPPRENEKKPNGILNKPTGTGSLGRKSNQNGQGNGSGNGHVKTVTPEKPVHEDIHHKLHTVTAPSITPDNTQASAVAPSSDFLVPSAPKSRGARSTRSTATAMTSRPKSVHPTTGAVQGYEDDDDIVEGETLGDRHKRKWKAFHEGRGVRTVVGSIGGVKDGESRIDGLDEAAVGSTWTRAD